MARSSSLPDLRSSTVAREEDGYEEEIKRFNEISLRNASVTKLPESYKDVSRWERRTVESVLHIFYDDIFCESPYDVLKKVVYIGELSKEQMDHIRSIRKYLHFNTDVNELHFFGDRVVTSKLTPLLEQLDSEPEPLGRLVHPFIVWMIRLVNELKLCGNVSNAYEGVYTHLFCSFANMCCLESVMTICKAEQITWRNFRGLNKVVSRPDIRLYKYGVFTKSTRDFENVVSVVEVKKNRHHREPASSDSERSFDSLSTYSSRSSNTLDCKPGLAWLLNRQLLGQHAGELLLDLHQFNKKESDSSTYTMPGIIVKDTEVFFTLLEITKEHYKKLVNNLELDDSDKAVVYYSKPHDILKEEYRNIVIENLVKLNNMKYN